MGSLSLSPLSSFHAKYQNIAKITKTIVSIPALLKAKSDSQRMKKASST